MNEDKFVHSIASLVKKDQKKKSKNLSLLNTPRLSKQMSLLSIENKTHKRNSSILSKKHSSTSGTKYLTIDETSKVQKSEASNIKTQTVSHKTHKGITANNIKQSLIEFYNFKKSLSPSPSKLKMTKYEPPKKKGKHISNCSGTLYKNKYSKYNTQELSYKISNEYSKIDFDNKNFLDRMEFYTLKESLKNDKIDELVNENKPHISEKRKIECFNRLIADSNRRSESKKKIEGITYDDIIMHDIKQSLDKTEKPPMTKKKWEVIYNERFMKKYKDLKNIIDRQREEEEKEKKEKEDMIVKERERRIKKCFSKDKIEEINKRLYYLPKNKKTLFSDKDKEIVTSKEKSSNRQNTRTQRTKRNNKTERSTSKTNRYQYQPISRIEKAINEFFLKRK